MTMNRLMMMVAALMAEKAADYLDLAKAAGKAIYSACFWRLFCDRLLLHESDALRGCARRCRRVEIATFKNA